MNSIFIVANAIQRTPAHQLAGHFLFSLVQVSAEHTDTFANALQQSFLFHTYGDAKPAPDFTKPH
jgi:hypothetical protein